MAKKKKEEDIYEEYDEDLDYEEDSKEVPEFNEDEPQDSLALANQISKESETARAFKELPKEVKFSYYDKRDKEEVKHFSRAYRTHQYIEKLIDLRMKEDERLAKARINIKKVNDKQKLKEYLRSIGRSYLLNDIDDLTNKELGKIYEYIQKLKPNYLLETIEDNKKEVSNLYQEYNIENQVPEYIDDMGNIGKIMDTSLTSMGFKGHASQHSIMTIQAVRNEDIQVKAEKKRAFGFMDAIKNKLG